MSASILPDASALLKASKLNIFDSQGKEVDFGTVFKKEKVIVVFIRHFFCGNCQQQYVEQLAAVPKDGLEKASTKIVVVGCGEWNPIKSYAETTGFQGTIFADPSRQVYHALGMDIKKLAGTPAGEKKRSYLITGRFSNAMLSIWKGPLKNLSLIGKQGNISQLGGEFILGPGLECSYAYRMQHSEDHAEVADLMKAAGVELS
ncbi:AhpC/TSA antioxidant enzyme-domain-containing protein [Collybia nuda]|uniref:AhpC/TSA antioxidant enzyme-domain-containing protein n=1 Tax=Collybia nuda TaxID=64659 RepID=A0A9P5YF18_9AGAR|nr:AhpC/TSA antioxidant enzyme-domain-containing protein [Collybia nuda]